jgi:hypothetical protein
MRLFNTTLSTITGSEAGLALQSHFSAAAHDPEPLAYFCAAARIHEDRD